MAALQVRVLGGIALEVDGAPVRLPPRLTLLLGLLTAGGDGGVEFDVLLEQLYAGNPPPTADAAIRVHLAKLRDALEPGRDRAVSTRVARMPQRWRLRLEEDECDARLFAAEAGQGRALLRQGAPGEAVRMLRSALDRWAEPYAGMEGDVVDAERTVLTRLHRQAGHDLAAAHLADGDPETALAVADGLQRADPWDEDLVLLRIRATYAGAGQERALALLRTHLADLDTELGLDPSPRLLEAEQAVLRHDPAWAPATRAAPTAAGAPPSRLVGRDRLLGDVRRHLDSGQPVLLRGEGGIGKTAILQELHRGPERTVLVSAAAASTPYSLLLELLAAHPTAAQDPDRQLLRESVAGTAIPDDLELVAEDLAERHLTPETVLLVDDAEAADAPSVRVLGLLAARGVRLVVARRPGREPPGPWGARTPVTIDVGPLTPDETRQLAARLRPGAELDDDQIRVIGGVPLLVEYAVEPALGLDALGERLLDPLEDSARAGASMLAVVGTPIALETASRLLGGDAVEDLLVARVLRVQGDHVGMAHPYLTSAVRESLGRLACTEILREVLDSEWEIPALLLTDAVETFGAGLPDALVARWALAAGRESIAGGDWEGADPLLARAADLGDPTLAQAAEQERARALMRTGRVVDAREVLVPVMRRLRAEERDAELAACLDEYAGGPARIDGGEMHVVERHARWLLDRDELDPDTRVRVLDALTRTAPVSSLDTLTEELLAECARASSPFSQVCALEARWRRSHYAGEVPTRRAKESQEAVWLAEQLGDIDLQVRMIRHLLDDLLAMGWGSEAAEQLDRLDEISRQRRHAHARWWHQLLGVDALLRRGEADAAMLAAQEVHDQWPRVPALLRENFLMTQQFVALYLTDHELLAASLRDVVTGPESLWVPDLVPEMALLMVDAQAGRASADDVRAGIDRVVAAPHGWRRIAELALAGRAAVAAGVAAPELRRTLLPYERCWVTLGPAVATLGPAAGVLSALAELEGDHREAARWGEQARQQCDAMDAPWWADTRDG